MLQNENTISSLFTAKRIWLQPEIKNITVELVFISFV